MSQRIAILLVVFSILAALVQPGRAMDTWCSTPVGLHTDGQGNIYATEVYYTQKLAPDGTPAENTSGSVIEIKHCYDGHDDQQDEPWVEAKGAAVDSSGNLYFVGDVKMTGSTTYDIGLLKFDAEGEWRCSTHYNGPSNLTDKLDSIVSDQNGNLYLSGVSYGQTTGADIVTLKYTPSGDSLPLAWAERYDENNRDQYPVNIAVDGSGNVYVIGYDDTGQGAVDTTTFPGNNIVYQKKYVIMKYDGGGTPVNKVFFPGDRGIDLACDSQGKLCVTGEVLGSVGLIKYDFSTVDPQGNPVVLWGRIIGDPTLNERARDILVDNADNVYVLAIAYRGATNYDYMVIKTDSQGNMDFQNTGIAYYDSGEGHYDSPRALARSGGTVYLTGSSIGAENYDIATAQISGFTTGETYLAAERYDIRTSLPFAPPVPLEQSVLHDMVKEITVDINGNVILSGTTVQATLYPNDTSPTKYNYTFSNIIIKYNPSLEKQWVWPDELEHPHPNP